MNRHNIRTKRYFNSKAEAVEELKKELVDYNYTTRTFWAEGQRWIARKTNKMKGYVNLTVKPWTR